MIGTNRYSIDPLHAANGNATVATGVNETSVTFGTRKGVTGIRASTCPALANKFDEMVPTYPQRRYMFENDKVSDPSSPANSDEGGIDALGLETPSLTPLSVP